MRFKNSFQLKFFSVVLVTVLISFLSVGVFVGVRNKKQAVNKAHQYTQMIAENQAINVASFFEYNGGIVQTLSVALSENINPSSGGHDGSFDEMLLAQSVLLGENINTWIALDNSSGSVGEGRSDYSLIQYSKDGSNTVQSNQIADFSAVYSSILNDKALSYSDPFYLNGGMYIKVGAPIVHDNKVFGCVGLTINLAVLNAVINQPIKGGFITVLSNSATFVAHSNSTFLGKTFAENFPQESAEYSVGVRIAKAESFDMTTPFGGEDYYSFFIPVKIGLRKAAWSVEATAPMSVLVSDSSTSIFYSALVALFVLLFMIIILWMSIKRMTNPIAKVTHNLNLLSTGNTRGIERLSLSSNDELQKMGDSLNQVVEGLRKTENFALEIGKGNLNDEFEVASEEDDLGIALLAMRDNLVVKNKELAERKLEDDRSNWSTQGIAKFSDILRQDTNDMKKLGLNIMSNLVQYLGVNQGALFVQSEDDVDAILSYELVTAIAYDRAKFMQKQIKSGEGLIGRCAFEKKTIFITELPGDYANITSGLGTANPSCILLVPCALNDIVYGVIELASFTILEQHEIDFVEKLGATIAATISNVRINEKTSKLLADSQNQSEELAAQEEELRQNLEEMETTSEDLKRQMETNAKMRADLKKQNALLDALLFSLPDYIYFKDEESRFLRISKSMLSLFDAEDVSEVIGKSDFDYHTAENAQKYYDDEKEIIRNKKGFVDNLQAETLRDGSVIWNSVSKLPILLENGECIGTFGISKNVTDIKELELSAKEQNALLDALLKLLPDYIYFKDKESKFLRISDSMLNLFDAESVSEVIGKSDFDYHTPDNAQKYYDDEQEIMNSRAGFIDKLQPEILRDGSTIWNSVSKLPILTEDDRCIGTFGISKNVTEIKDLEISAKAKSEELAAQEEELRQNLEELETVNEHNQDLRNQMKLQKQMLIEVLNEIPMEICLKDSKGKFILANNKIAANYNQNADGVIGKTDRDFYTKKEADKISKVDKAVLASGKELVEDVMDPKNKTLLLKRSIKKPFDIKYLGEKGLLGMKIDVEDLTSTK